jgi:hypothetical protein
MPTIVNMSVEKQDGKIAAIFTLGSFIEDSLEKYKKELLGLEGTRQALFVLVKKFEEYIMMVDKELETKVITMSEASVAKRHVITCIGIVRSLAVLSDTQLHQTEGKISAADKFVTDLKKFFDEEKTSLVKMNQVKDDILKAEMEVVEVKELAPEKRSMPSRKKSKR